MGNLLCCLSQGEQDKKVITSRAYTQLYWLYQDAMDSNKLLARSNRELKRKLLLESKRNDQLSKIVDDLYGDKGT